jgi:predicted transposase YbfD/YdcC
MTVPVAAADPVCGHPDFWLADVVLRLARDDERREWDQLMDTLHYLGFRQFAGRGLRYVAEWHGRWLALLGWQTGVFQCAPRDKWIGWHKGVQMPRLHLCANNTRFLILPAATGVKNLGSYVLGANLRRLSADWERNWGHPLLLAEAFVEMRRYKGSVYLAANWIPVGVTKGYARSNGKYTNKHGVKKKMLVYPLQAGARELLRDPQERAEWNCEAVRVQYSQAELASLRELLEEVPDARKARGLRHPLGAVLALLVLAKLAGRHGGRAAEKFCKQLPQRDLRVLRCRFDPLLRRYEAPSDTTFQRALAEVEAGTLERVVQRWTQPRCGRKPRALAGDGKRIRGANRLTAEGLHWETVTLVDHATGLPVASRSYGEEGGEPAALRALLEEVDLRGVTVTLDAGHASYATEAALVEQNGADYMIGIKGNAPATLAQLQALDWRGAQRTNHRWHKAHGRWEWRKLEALDLQAPDLEAVRLRFRHARQALRVTHRTKTSKHGEVTEEVLYAITSLPRAQAGARRLLTLHRGHWRVENSNHYSRDTTFREDASRMRTGHAPANNAALNNLALAIVVLRREPGETVPETLTRLTVRRERALEVILSPH